MSSTIWFTSDHHWGHARVIEYSHRPFDSLEEMNEGLITNWASLVKPGDVVYHLGDFAFLKAEEVPSVVRRLTGQIHLIRGNHDRFLKGGASKNLGFAWVGDYKEIKVGEQKIVLCHYPMLTWNRRHHGSWDLHGHSHGSLPVDLSTKRLDVGVDSVARMLRPHGWQGRGRSNDYRPLSFEEIEERMKAHGIGVVDHHKTRRHEE